MNELIGFKEISSKEVERPDFEDFIPLNIDMLPQEALELLYQYYPETSRGFFEGEFPDLANAEGKVHFENSTLQRHDGAVKLLGKVSDGRSFLLSFRQ